MPDRRSRQIPSPEKQHNNYQIDCIPAIIHQHRSGTGFFDRHPDRWIGVEELRKDSMSRQHQNENNCAVGITEPTRYRIDRQHGHRKQIARGKHMDMDQDMQPQMMVHRCKQSSRIQQPETANIQHGSCNWVNIETGQPAPQQAARLPCPLNGKRPQQQCHWRP